MRLTTVVPLASLAALAITLLIALRSEEPEDLLRVRMPADELAPHAAPVIGAATLTGRVVDADEVGIADASVSTLVRGRPLWTRTDRAGAFRLTELDAGPCEVHVLARGYPTLSFPVSAGAEPVELVLGAPFPEQPRLESAQTADLSGAIDPGEGEADASGYEVLLLPAGSATEFGSGMPRRATTDSEGRYRFDALERATYRVIVLPPYARGGTWPDLLTGWDGTGQMYNHDAGGENPPQLALGLLSGIIEGYFRDDRGRPLEGGLVEVSPMTDGNPAALPAVRTDAAGRFRLRHVPPGRYSIRATAGAHSRETTVLVPARGRVDPGL